MENQKVIQAIQEFRANEYLVIEEPCDCGYQIRHSNGGNYHFIISLETKNGKFYERFDDTCELTDPAEWREITENEAITTIKSYSDWL